MKTSLWLAALLLTAPAHAAPAPRSTPLQPIPVRFGHLLWLYGAHGVPRLAGGKVLVPVADFCTLLAAPCDIGATGATVAGKRVAVTEGYAPLTDLGKSLGFKVGWDARSETAYVTGNFKIGSPLRGIRNQAYGFSFNQTRPTAPLKAKLTPQGNELRLLLTGAGVRPGSSLTLFMGQSDGNFSMMSPHGLGSPDIPKGNSFCAARWGRCEMTLARPTYLLAILERP